MARKPRQRVTAAETVTAPVPATAPAPSPSVAPYLDERGIAAYYEGYKLTLGVRTRWIDATDSERAAFRTLCNRVGIDARRVK